MESSERWRVRLLTLVRGGGNTSFTIPPVDRLHRLYTEQNKNKTHSINTEWKP